jgi:hypothetical protein
MLLPGNCAANDKEISSHIFINKLRSCGHGFYQHVLDWSFIDTGFRCRARSSTIRDESLDVHDKDVVLTRFPGTTQQQTVFGYQT